MKNTEIIFEELIKLQAYLYHFNIMINAEIKIETHFEEVQTSIFSMAGKVRDPISVWNADDYELLGKFKDMIIEKYTQEKNIAIFICKNKILTESLCEQKIVNIENVFADFIGA